MILSQTALRWVQLNGPPRGPGDGEPFWSLYAGAPYRSRDSLASYAHPLRTLALDGEDSRLAFGGTIAQDRPFRSSRLLDVRLVVGANSDYAPNSDPADSLILNFASGTPAKIVNRDKQTVFRTRLAAHAPEEAAFAHVVAEPWPAPTGQKGDFVDQLADTPADWLEIPFPPLRHVDGVLRVVADRAAVGFLKALLPAAGDPVELALRPDGVAFDGAVKLPGAQDALAGRFLLAPPDPVRAAGAAASLYLVVDDPRYAANWMKAWVAFWSPKATAPLAAPKGFDLRARLAGAPPALHWALTRDLHGALVLPAVVDAPAQDVRLEWRGALQGGRPDGVAVVSLTRLRLVAANQALALAQAAAGAGWPANAVGPLEGAVALIAEADSRSEEATASWLDFVSAADIKLTLKPAKKSGVVAVDHDERDLADRLRQAHGWPAPLLVSRPGEDLRFDNGDRPLASGFAPLERGWLQIPFPNLPALDLTKDSQAASPAAASSGSAIDGFVRFAASAATPLTFAGSGVVADDPPLIGDSAPWSMTVEAAKRAVALIGRSGGAPYAAGAFENPAFTARGWFWLSADRPDGLEALPRLGAGPGAFFDVAFSSRFAPPDQDRVVAFGVAAATFSVTDVPKPDAPAQICALEATSNLSFDASAKLWTSGPAGAAAGRAALAAGRAALEGGAPDGGAGVAATRAAARAAEQSRDQVAADLAAKTDRRQGLRVRADDGAIALAAENARLDGLSALYAKLAGGADAARRPAVKAAIAEASRLRDAAQLELTRFNAEAARLDAELHTLLDFHNAAQAKYVAAAKALAAAEAAVSAAGDLDPWPCVAWLGHERLPLAALMPMTRSAASAARPLESRELAPFVGAPPAPDGRTPFVAVTWSAGAFAKTDTPFNKLAAAWPPASAGAGAGAAKPAWRNIPAPPNPGGVGFAALGAPGVELSPTGAAAWSRGFFALRYDLPALDEAFATAGLPQVADAPADPDGAPPPPPETPATALDWPKLAGFWSQQERKRQLALAIDSYLTPYVPADATLRPFGVDNLVQGATLAMTAAFDVAAGTPPYGALAWSFSGKPTVRLSGDPLLLGLDGALAVDPVGKTLTYAPPAGALPQAALLGFSPSTFDIDGYRYDNASIGVADPLAGASAQSRPLRNLFGGADNQRWLASAAKATPLGPSGLKFWFRDAPVDANGFYGKFWSPGDAAPGIAVDFSVWLDPLDGLEWRLAGDVAAFNAGDFRLAFQGFALEPLRLLGLKLEPLGGGRFSGAPERVQLLARLSLTSGDRPAADSRGLVALNLLRDGAELALDDVVAWEGDLRFAIDAERRVAVTVKPTKPVQGALRFGLATVGLSFHGYPVELAGATFGPDDANPGHVALAWDAPDPANAAALRIERLRLTVSDGKAELALDSALYLWPDDLKSDQAPIKIARAGGRATAQLFGATFNNIAWSELDGAAAATFSDSPVAATPIEPLSFANARAAFLLAVALDAPLKNQPHQLPLLAGRCEADFVAPPSGEPVGDFAFPVRRLAIRIDLAPGPKGLRATGALRLTGTLRATSAILWPAVETSAVAKGVVKVTRAADHALREHAALWRFEDHRLPFAALSANAQNGRWSFSGGWSGVALVRHILSDPTARTSLTFDSVESFAFGKFKALVADPSKRLGFAARYRKPDETTGASAPMIRPGLGALDFVLSGAFAADFQNGLGADAGDRLVLIGGCLGAPKVAAPQPALRLPFLVGVGVGDRDPLRPKGLSQAGLPAAGASLAWMDAIGQIEGISPAAAPKSGREEDIWAAMRAGALIDGQAGETIVAAQIVEQWFAAASATAGQQIDVASWWLAAAVSVSALWALRPADSRLAVYSWVAGTRSRNQAEPNFGRGVAAALTPPAYPVEDPGLTVGDPVMISCGDVATGDGVAETPWRGGDPPTDGDAPSAAAGGYAAQLAASRHRRPRFAALRYFVNGQGKLGLAARYLAFAPPRTGLRDLALAPPRAPGRSAFAEPARGYAAVPGDDALSRLWPALEGRTTAVRDDSDEKASGVAGLARPLTLSRQAVGGGGDDGLLSKLAWIVEQRAPVYLPLDIQDLQATPLGALETLPRAARLPVDADIAAVLDKLNFDPKRLSAQAFLPGAATTMALGERAGVATSRRIYLMTPTAAHTPAFDEHFTRFGRPADVGPSVRRWLRTPRPAPLPENVGAPLSDRRPQASALRPDRSAGFFIGPADTIQGEAEYTFAAWTVTAVASPYSHGVVSDLWDGATRLRCRLEIAAKTAPTDEPGVVLGKLLFPLDKDKNLLASASLRVGGRLFAAQRLRIEPAPPAGPTGPAAWTVDPKAPGVHVALADIVVETSPAGAADPGIAAAFAGAPAPVAELRLTVHPGFPEGIGRLNPTQNSPLPSADQPGLAQGDSRPPVTLIWSLPGVMSARGALPLTPATLLFNDPAYDSSLANPAHNVQAKLPAKATGGAPPPTRGAVQATFSADRARVYRGGTIAFMLDVGFEKPASPRAPQPGGSARIDGDLYTPSPDAPLVSLPLSIQLVPHDPRSPTRPLRLGKSPPRVQVGAVHQFSLASLTEVGGTASALLSAGDALTLTVSTADSAVVALWNTEAAAPIAVDLTQGPDGKKVFSLALSALLTDEPVAEPPSALYFALMGDPATKLAAPLHAQSPLPWRVDFRNLKKDFRSGLVRRTASFVWGFGRAKAQLLGGSPVKAYVVKMDRNGQTHLPDALEFQPPEKLGV